MIVGRAIVNIAAWMFAFVVTRTLWLMSVVAWFLVVLVSVILLLILLLLRWDRLQVTAYGFPWQDRLPHWSHHPMTNKKWGWKAVPGLSRFGNGVAYKVGFEYGNRCLIMNLLVGQLRFSMKP